MPVSHLRQACYIMGERATLATALMVAAGVTEKDQRTFPSLFVNGHKIYNACCYGYGRDEYICVIPSHIAYKVTARVLSRTCARAARSEKHTRADVDKVEVGGGKDKDEGEASAPPAKVARTE